MTPLMHSSRLALNGPCTVTPYITISGVLGLASRNVLPEFYSLHYEPKTAGLVLWDLGRRSHGSFQTRCSVFALMVELIPRLDGHIKASTYNIQLPTVGTCFCYSSRPWRLGARNDLTMILPIRHTCAAQPLDLLLHRIVRSIR